MAYVGTAEVYEIRVGTEWATFLLYLRPQHYVLAIESSYGGYVYRWTHPGKSIYEFLAGLHKSYLCSKMTDNEMEFDPEGTCEYIKQQIVERRRCETAVTKEDAREEWELARQLESGAIDFATWLDVSEMFPGDYEMAIQRPGPRARRCMAFYDIFWPEFAKALTQRASELGRELS